MPTGEATRAVYWHITHVWIMYALLVPTLAIFFYGFWRRIRFWMTGKLVMRFDRIPERLQRVLVYALGQRKLLKNKVAGAFHSALFWSFCLLFLGTVVVAIHEDFKLRIMQGAFYLWFQSVALNVAGLMATFALVAALVYRYIVRPPRLRQGRASIQSERDDAINLWLLLLIMVQGFVISATRIAVSDDPWSAYRFVARWLVHLFDAVGASDQALITQHSIWWWFHLVTVFTWMAWIPFSKFIHIFTSPLSIFFSDLAPKGDALQPMDFEKAERLGASALTDFTWKDLLDLDACTECGRCQEVCPAYASGAPLSPKNLILDLKAYMNKAALRPEAAVAALGPMVGGVIKEETLWACTTCRACMEACPVAIEHVPKIVDMRRHLVMEEASAPETVQDALKSLENRAHPYKGAGVSRTDWCEGLDVPEFADIQEAEILYWVGCTAAFDQRNQKVARAFAQLMIRAGVKFGILGKEEGCTGDPARRMGNEFLYDMIARQNIETLKGYKFNRIVSTCPHCLNQLKNEYRKLGGEFEVIHHTQLIEELVKMGKLKPDQAVAEKVTFHDPCYLGRYNDIFDAPRNVLEELPMLSTVEMARSREKSLCCGAGGGHAWMEDGPEIHRVNQMRAEEALGTGASTVATGCPFCLQMMEDGVKTVGGPNREVKVLDVAELVLQSVTAREPAKT